MVDYLNIGEDPGASALLERCVRGLVFALERFDLGYWTCGHLGGRRVRPASYERHCTHILMMQSLHRMIHEEAFAAAATRWQGYAEDSRSRARASLERARAAIANVGG
jgi:hypothetical protein